MASSEIVYILLGSNLGDRSYNLQQARSIIAYRSKIIRTSLVYETKAWGKTSQPAYFNQVLELNTFLKPFALLNWLKSIEKSSGRKNKGQMMPRKLDIDILFYGNSIIASKKLTIPHPGIPYRRFTLIPLKELFPDFVHPLYRITIKDLLDNCEDKGVVRNLDGTDAL